MDIPCVESEGMKKERKNIFKVGDRKRNIEKTKDTVTTITKIIKKIVWESEQPKELEIWEREANRKMCVKNLILTGSMV